MNKRQENKFSMYTAVDTQMDDRSGAGDLSPALIAAHKDLKDKKREIEIKDQEKGTVASGKTDAKVSAGRILMERIILIAGPLFAWAVVKNNPEVKSIAGLKRSHLKKMRVNELAQKAEQIFNMATQYLGELGDYDITQEQLTEFNRLISEYRDALGDRESSVASRVSARVSLETLFQEADDLLRLRIDPLMEKVKAKNLEFYNGYKAARVIKDLKGSGKRKVTESTVKTV